MKEKGFLLVAAISSVDVSEGSVLIRNTCDFVAACGVLGVRAGRGEEAGLRDGCAADE